MYPNSKRQKDVPSPFTSLNTFNVSLLSVSFCLTKTYGLKKT
jgi:hypothetical protein